MNIFSEYGEYYDLFNSGKKYDQEVEYIIGLFDNHSNKINKVLEFGCGTGGHAFALAERQIAVTGIDQSDEMIALADKKKQQYTKNCDVKVHFQKGDIRNCDLNEKYDAVISLFHVVSYLQKNKDLLLTLKSARKHLESGALFVFDIWYGPAVLSDLPYVRERVFDNYKYSALRIATPTMDTINNLVKIDFDFRIRNKETNEEYQFTEQHIMRYWFYPELEYLLDCAGFTITSINKWMTSETASSKSWYAAITATVK